MVEPVSDTTPTHDTYVERYSEEFSGKYDHLMALVGKATEPVIRNILVTGPREIALIHTPESKRYLEVIHDAVDLDMGAMTIIEVDGGKPEDVYGVVKRQVTKWGDPSRVAIDISGGTKAMSACAAVAAFYIGADVIYSASGDRAGGAEHDREQDRPAELTNPFEATMDPFFQRGRKLYLEGDFLAAAQIFEGCLENTGDIRLKFKFEFLSAMATFHAHCYGLDFRHAFITIMDILENHRKYLKSHALRDWIDRREPVIRLLFEKADFTKNTSKSYELKFLEDFRAVRHYAGYLFGSAALDEQDARYSIASMKMYRLMELLSQHRLAIHGIDTEKVSKKDVPADVLASFREHVFRHSKRMHRGGEYASPGSVPLPGRISLLKGLVLLKAFGDEMFLDMDLVDMENRVYARNKSPLVHGFAPVIPKSYLKMKKVVERLLARICRLNGEVFDPGYFDPFPMGELDEL